MTPLNFDALPALAKAAVPDEVTPYHDDLLLWQETMPGGMHWSGLVRRGNTLRLTDLRGGANVSALFYNWDEKTERYNMPDTLKAQHTAYLTQGHVCYSDMGRILCALAEDTCGWHDTLCGVSNASLVEEKYGIARYQEHRNGMYRSGEDGLLIELGKWGLGKRDMVPNVNFFSKVVVDEAGDLNFVRAHSQAGHYIDLRCEMNVLVVLSSAQHPLDPHPAYDPKPVQLSCWRSGTASKHDLCRLSCSENERGYINTERFFL